VRIPRVLGGGLAAAVCLVAWLAAGPGIGVAGADCSGPTLTVTPSTAAPGAPVTIAGLYFGDACNDTGAAGPPLGRPLRGVEIWVRVGEVEKQVAIVDAGPGYDFAVEVAVPPSLGTGPGQVVARSSTFSIGPGPAGLVVEGAAVRVDDPALYDARRFAAPIDGVDVVREGQSSSRSVWPWVLIGAAGGAAVAVSVVGVARRRGPC
jgi:hypothetical protein